MWSRLVVAAAVLTIAACSPAGVQETSSTVIASTTPPTTALETTSRPSATAPPTTASETTSPPSTTTAQQVDPYLEFTYGARQNDLPRVDAHWVGLPQNVDYVTIARATTDLVQEQKIEGNVTFQFAKPGWTSCFTFTAYDAEGTAIASEEVVIDGGRCSASGQRPGGPNADLPDSVEVARVRLLEATEQCLFGAFDGLAAEDGDFFGFGPSELAVGLKELDRRQAIMDDIRVAFQLPGRADTRHGGSVYVFGAGAVEIVLGSDGRWIAAHA